MRLERVVVAQMGARMHYAVPRILHTRGALEVLYTDLCAARGLGRAATWVPPTLRGVPIERLAARIPYGVPPSKVRTIDRVGIRYYLDRVTAGGPGAIASAHLRAGRSFAGAVADRIVSQLGGGGGLYAFNSAGLEALLAARERGIPTAMEQTIVPLAVRLSILERETREWPGWADDNWSEWFLPELIDREREEWDAADVIVCASEFVRDGIASCGGPEHKCHVVPYGVDPPDGACESRQQSRGDALRVLTVGQVSLRKGLPYVLAAARRLSRQMSFRVVGPIRVPEPAARGLAAAVDLVGPVPRSRVAVEFGQADVLLLPSIAEGSATVLYEALSMGLPIVCTPNAGSVIRDGVDGFVVPIRDVDAVVDRLERLDSDRGLLAWMSSNARARAREFTVNKYGERLLKVLVN